MDASQSLFEVSIRWEISLQRVGVSAWPWGKFLNRWGWKWFSENRLIQFPNTQYQHGILQNQRIYFQNMALQRALSLCQDAENVTTENCQNGVWMDYWAAQGMLIDQDFHSDQDPISICFEFPESMSSCQLYAPTAYLLRYPRDYAGAMQIMCRANEEGWWERQGCFVGVGMQTAKENQQDYAPVEQVCALAPDLFSQKACFTQGGLSYYKTSHKSQGVPSVLCENLHQFKEVCLDWVVEDPGN
jgi:hypothetical protein